MELDGSDCASLWLTCSGVKTMIVFSYTSKNVMKENIGSPLRYIETSLFGEEYVRDGQLPGSNRPRITGRGREFFATVTMRDGKIAGVK